MKYAIRSYALAAALLCMLFTQAQNFPGKIIRPAGTTNLRTSSGTPTAAFPLSASAITGQNILDPNNDGVVSSALTGFTGGNDVAGSEIAYKPIVPYNVEPYGDLRRGPDHLFSDFVPGVDNASYYMYYRGTPAGTEALQFRIRMGTIMAGAKGYSILLDTDGRFGGSGANADPNFIAATTGTNGNPGFEIEINLFTQTSGQTGIAIYNVDNNDNPTTPIWSAANWHDYSQIALAATSDNGDPDFFIDFFIPFEKLSALGVTASTPLRAVATTVMAPLPAIGGPKSDIYGLADGSYKNSNSQYEAFINAQPPFTSTTLGTPGTTSPTSAMCTAAPTVTTVTAGTGNGQVQGSWLQSALAGSLGSTTITVYRTSGGTTTTLGTVNTTSGAGWSLTGLTINAGDIITAKAKGSTESMCLESNAVRATACTNPASRPVDPALLCGPSITKGLTGTNRNANWTVWVSNVTRNTTDNSTTNAGTTGAIFDNIVGTNWDYSSGCTGGSNMLSGSYRVWYVDANGCQSDPVIVCQAGNGGSALASATPLIAPVVTIPTNFTSATKAITGTASAGSTVFLFVNGVQVASTVATGSISNTVTGTFNFTGLDFVEGDRIVLTCGYNTGTVSTSYCGARSASTFTVGCFVSRPIITVNGSGQLKIGTPITGTSADPAGTTIRVYNSGNMLLATTTVQADGSWTTTGATFSNSFTGVAVAGTTYYATAQSGSCLSANSLNAAAASSVTNTNRCGTITANLPAGSITSATTQVTVAYNNAMNLTITLYEDGQPVVSQSGLTGNNSVNLNVANRLYAGNGSTTGVLTIGVQENSQEEIICPANYYVQPSCTAPAAPTVSPATAQTVAAGSTITFTVHSPIVGVFYTVSDQTTGRELAPGVWATSTADFTMTTTAVNSAVNAVVKAVQLASNGEVCVGATNRNITILPVTLLRFSCKKTGGTHQLIWTTSQEINTDRFEVERSTDGATFTMLGQVRALGRGADYQYEDLAPAKGSNFYRLRMVDVDGQFKYSPVVVLQSNGGSLLLGQVGPNPFRDRVAVSFQMGAAQLVTVSLVDANGKIVAQRQVKATAGNNQLTLESLGRQSAGLYLVQVQAAAEVLHYKLVKE